MAAPCCPGHPSDSSSDDRMERRIDMTDEWIIDVLADLRQYARRNRYACLAEQLDDAIVIAAGEILNDESFRLPPRPCRTVAELSPVI